MSRLEDLAPHVKRKLQDNGAADFTKQGPPATRKAHMIHCPGCGKPVMRGLLSMPTPWVVDADPPALSLESEAMALLDGRATYDLSWRYGWHELDYRGDWAWHNPDPRPGKDIVAEHRCHTATPWAFAPSTLPPIKKPVAAALPDKAPF